MPRTSSRRASNGNGSVRKINITRNGRTYTYWQGRYTSGFHPGTGKQMQKSIYGQTKREVEMRLKEITLELHHGTYHEPCKLTFREWSQEWTENYLASIKPRTADSYKSTVKKHLCPAFGATKLVDLDNQMIQTFISSLDSATKDRKALSPKTIKNTHGVLHTCLQQAVDSGLIERNPAEGCKLPRREKGERFVFDEDSIKPFIDACHQHSDGILYLVTMFCGLREGELLGLTWDCIDLDNAVITVKQQLQRQRAGEAKGTHTLGSTKNGKTRYITVAAYVIDLLRLQKAKQAVWERRAGDAWNNPDGLVFTDELGRSRSAQTVYLRFKKLVSELGYPQARLHDLRHTFATMSLRNGDDVKTVQEHLGHYSAAFTLDMYGHVTPTMHTDSANRMQAFIEAVTKEDRQG